MDAIHVAARASRVAALRAPPTLPPPIRLTADTPVRFVTTTATTAPPPLKFCVAVDFDGTLCRSAWPKIGAELPGAVAFLRWLGDLDIWKVIWTCRHGHQLDEALAWLAERGFPRDWWDAVNNTPEPIARHFGGDTRKIGCNAFIDDRAIGFPADPADPTVPYWSRIKDALLARIADWNASPH